MNDTFVFYVRPHKGSNKKFKPHQIGNQIFIGVHGEEPYALGFKNNSDRRTAVRFTIDGTDIITGKPAGLAPGGCWIVEPYGTTELEAWPESSSGGGRFVFGHKDKSVALHTHGNTNHAGILAAAVFVETAERRPRYTPEFGSSLMGGYGGDLLGGGLKGGGGMMKSMGPATGVGSYVKQEIKSAEGLEKPRRAAIMQIYYVWQDDLDRMLREAAPPQLDYIPGFPAATRDDIITGIDLSAVPRVETDDPRFVMG